MRKKFIALALIAVCTLVMSGCDMLPTVQGPDLEKPVFVKQLIYADDMDLELQYICNEDWEKTISKVKIPDAPKGVDCVVYNQEEDYDGKYELVTVYIGVNHDKWDDETGLPEDISISKMEITWDDGTTTTEDMGSITIASKALNHDMTDESGGSGDGESYYFSLQGPEKRTEITGFELPIKEAKGLIEEMTLNDRLLSEISEKDPLVLQTGEGCEVSILMNSQIMTKYGNVNVVGTLLKKSGNKETAYANIFISRSFYENWSVTEYLRMVLEK